MPRDLDKPLTKAETRALWNAVRWMDHVLTSWRKEGTRDEHDAACLAQEDARLTTAKRALRKVNELRKQGL